MFSEVPNYPWLIKVDRPIKPDSFSQVQRVEEIMEHVSSAMLP
jgi:hypothetical protein